MEKYTNSQNRPAIDNTDTVGDFLLRDDGFVKTSRMKLWNVHNEEKVTVHIRKDILGFHFHIDI